MVQSPSWEANWFATSQEIPRISQNPKFHYRTHKRPPPLSIMGQPNPVHNPHPTSWRSILILSTHLRLGLSSGLLPSGCNVYTTSNKMLQNGYGYGRGPAWDNLTRITSSNINLHYPKRFSRETHLAYYQKKISKLESNFEFFVVRLYWYIKQRSGQICID